MKQGSNPRRGRNRGGGKRQPRNSNFDSNGPEGRVRGTAQQVYDKYLALARDAQSSGDRISSENYFQHAEHYFRIMSADAENKAANEQRNEQRNQQRGGRRNGSGEDQAENQSAENKGNEDAAASNAKGKGNGNGADAPAAEETAQEPVEVVAVEAEADAGDDDAATKDQPSVA